MLDVHPPHKPMHGLGEFFLHLFTITVGLLIAVGIEGAVERYEHHRLADEARETLRQEIEHNYAQMADTLTSIEAQQKRMKQNLANLEKVQLNPKGPEAADTSIDASYNSTTLEHTAWRTAQATGALSYMPYAEAEKFSSIYEAAEQFERSEQVITEDEAQVLGAIRKYPQANDRLSLDGANAMAERFGIWEGHLLVLHINARVLAEQEKAYLEGREPSKHMSEKIGN